MFCVQLLNSDNQQSTKVTFSNIGNLCEIRDSLNAYPYCLHYAIVDWAWAYNDENRYWFQIFFFFFNKAFSISQEAFENYTFLPFSVLLACFWVFTYYKVPETKNKTFEEISAIFQRGVDRYAVFCCSHICFCVCFITMIGDLDVCI